MRKEGKNMPEHIDNPEDLARRFVVDVVGVWFTKETVKSLTNETRGKMIVFKVEFQKRESVEVSVSFKDGVPACASYTRTEAGKKKTISAPYRIEVDGESQGEI